MSTTNNIMEGLENIPDNFIAINNRKLTNLTARWFEGDTSKFEAEAKKLNHKLSFDDVPKPSIVIPLYSKTDELRRLKFINFNADGSPKGSMVKNLVDDKLISFLWLNKELAESTGEVFITDRYFEAETVANIGDKSVVFCEPIGNAHQISEQICEGYKETSLKCCILSNKTQDKVDVRYTSKSLPFLIPIEDSFNSTYLKLGESALLNALEREWFPSEELIKLEGEETSQKGNKKKTKQHTLSVTTLQENAETTIKINETATAYISKINDSVSIVFTDEDGGQGFKLSSYLMPIAGIKNSDQTKSFVINTGVDTFLLPHEALASVSKLRAVLAKNNVVVYVLDGKEGTWLQTVLQLLCRSVTSEANVTQHNGWHTFQVNNTDGTQCEFQYYNSESRRPWSQQADIVFNFKHNRNKLKVIGTEEKFYTRLLPLLHNNPALCCSMLRAFAAPLRKFLNISPVMFNYFCRSKRGKSIMAAIGCAIMGITKITNIVRSYESWSGTYTGMLLMLPDFNDSLLCLDDLSTANPNIVNKFIYTLCNGETGASATQNREQRESLQFNCSVDSTAEGSLSDELGELGIKLKGGVRSRCADFALPSTENMGILTDLCHKKSAKEFFSEAIDIITNECRGVLWEKWLNIVTDIANNDFKLRRLNKQFKEFSKDCNETYAKLLPTSTQIQEILDNILLVGYTLDLLNEEQLITTAQIGFTGKEFVGYLLEWYLGDQVQINSMGLEYEVREKCREMIQYKHRHFTTIMKVTDEAGHERGEQLKHCGYIVITRDLQDVNHSTLPKHKEEPGELWYFTADQLNTYFNSSSKTKTKEIIGILKKYNAIGVNGLEVVQRHRLPGKRNLGAIFYVINPYKMLLDESLTNDKEVENGKGVQNEQ